MIMKTMMPCLVFIVDMNLIACAVPYLTEL